jgi:hypothetical protein
MANFSVQAAFFASNARRQEKILRMSKVARRLPSFDLPQGLDADSDLNKSGDYRLLSWMMSRSVAVRCRTAGSALRTTSTA